MSALEMETRLLKIAQSHIGSLVTFETQNSDDKDFHEIHCVNLKNMLLDAYQLAMSDIQNIFKENSGERYFE